jgi:hypothetical protein
MSRTTVEVCTAQQLQPRMARTESHREETQGREAEVENLPLVEVHRSSEEERPSENSKIEEKTEADLDRHRRCRLESPHHPDLHPEEGLHPPIDHEGPLPPQEEEIVKRLANSSSRETVLTTNVHSCMSAKAAGEDLLLDEPPHHPPSKRETESRSEIRDPRLHPMYVIYTRRVCAHTATNASSNTSILRRQQPSRRQKQRKRKGVPPLHYAFVFLEQMPRLPRQ